MALIFYLSSLPSLPYVPGAILQGILSYTAHSVEYAVLTILVFWAQGSSPNRQTLLISLFIVGLYAIGDEYHQSFIPNRRADIVDLLVDSAAGVLTLIWLRWRILRQYTRNRT